MAGGSGTRMKSTVPKQFLLIDGVPIIVHSIRKFLQHEDSISIVLVLPADHLDQWSQIKDEFFPSEEFIVAIGGSTRTASVQSGLHEIGEGLVAIHDAVRPFVSVDTISESYKSAEKFGSGIAVVKMKDSIRELSGDHSFARDRANYVLVQTPQTFRVDELKAAYQLIDDAPFTDDASVFEAAGKQIYLVDGTYDNIKITTPEDLK